MPWPQRFAVTTVCYAATRLWAIEGARRVPSVEVSKLLPDSCHFRWGSLRTCGKGPIADYVQLAGTLKSTPSVACTVTCSQPMELHCEKGFVHALIPTSSPKCWSCCSEFVLTTLGLALATKLPCSRNRKLDHGKQLPTCSSTCLQEFNMHWHHRNSTSPRPVPHR